MLQIEVKRKTVYMCTLTWHGMGYMHTDELHDEYLRLFEEEELPTIAKYFDVTFARGGSSWEVDYEAEFTSPNRDNLIALKHWYSNRTQYPALTEWLQPIWEAMQIVQELDKDGYLVTYVDIDEETEDEKV
jgi:hypothetical protein